MAGKKERRKEKDKQVDNHQPNYFKRKKGEERTAFGWVLFASNKSAAISFIVYICVGLGWLNGRWRRVKKG